MENSPWIYLDQDFEWAISRPVFGHFFQILSPDWLMVDSGKELDQVLLVKCLALNFAQARVLT